ncbi:hypothetical protein [Kitasatospora sp. KL5]|uniref:hypothetical protein n=1 Tax=Kitasatospora sp. KL5 TaxID=3425125 RepID=UPI003D6F239E
MALGQGWGRLGSWAAAVQCSGRAVGGRPRAVQAVLLPDEYGGLAAAAADSAGRSDAVGVVARAG